VTRYLDKVQPELGHRRAGFKVAAALYYAMCQLEEGAELARRTAMYIERKLLDSLVKWAWGDLKKVRGELRKIDRRVADDFADWSGSEAAGPLRRMLTKRRIKKREERPAKEAEKAAKKAAKQAEREAERVRREKE